MPLSCDLIGWRGTTNGDAGIATYFFFGGLLMVLGGTGEVGLYILLRSDTFAHMFSVDFGKHLPIRGVLQLWRVLSESRRNTGAFLWRVRRLCYGSEQASFGSYDCRIQFRVG